MSLNYALRSLQKILTNEPLEKYYNIPDNFKIKTNCSEEENKIILSILYYSYPEFSKIKELPFEISLKLVVSFILIYVIKWRLIY
jgi:hypothetical protein